MGFVWCFESMTCIYREDLQATRILCDLFAPLDVNSYLKLETYYLKTYNYQAWKDCLVDLDRRSIICRDEKMNLSPYLKKRYDFIDSDSLLQSVLSAYYGCEYGCESFQSTRLVLEICWFLSKDVQNFKDGSFLNWIAMCYPQVKIETAEFLLTLGFEFNFASPQLEAKRKELKQVNQLLLTLPSKLVPDLLKIVNSYLPNY